MKHPIRNLNKAFENRIRLGIMSVLVVNEFISFNDLKHLLEASDGNLSSHLKALEKLKYIRMFKSFIGRKPNTKYKVTSTGRKAFDLHLEALEKIIRDNK